MAEGKKPDLTGFYASEILNIMEQRGAKVNTPGIKIGKIKSVEPLLVTIDGADFNDQLVTIADDLKPHLRQCKMDGYFNIEGTWNPTVSGGDHSHTSTLNRVNGNGQFEGKIYFTDYGFKKDDIVLIFAEDDCQHFYIVSKIGGSADKDDITIRR